MSWRKEKKEHPWASKKQAKRIASDHAKQKHRPRRPQKGRSIVTNATSAASRDFTGLYGGAVKISQQKDIP